MNRLVADLAALRTWAIACPWHAVGTAVVVGAWLGLESRPPRGRLARAAITVIGGVGARIIRIVALRGANRSTLPSAN